MNRIPTTVSILLVLCLVVLFEQVGVSQVWLSQQVQERFLAPAPDDAEEVKKHTFSTRPEVNLENVQLEEEEGAEVEIEKGNDGGQERDEEEFMRPSFPFPDTPDTLVVDARYHRLQDPIYGLMDSPVLSSDADILNTLRGIVDIWARAGIYIRFRINEALSYERIDQQRAKAYLFYVFGHPWILPNRKRTQILLRQDRDWVRTRYGEYIRLVLPHYLELRQSSELVSAISSQEEERHFFSKEGADENGDGLVLESEFVNWIGKIKRMKDSPGVRLKFSSTFDPKLAFASIAGVPLDGGRRVGLSRACLVQSLREPMGVGLSEVRLGFRRFYLDANVSVEETTIFADAMRYRPMLFLHYAIGRDSQNNTLLRSEWEFRNMLHIYPVPYYHDMNGRGSTNWMDVVVRTSSCWSPTNKNITLPFVSGVTSFSPERGEVGSTKAPFLTHCRWGVRWWEKHLFTVREFSRMVAHELGHTLGLEHPDPKCKIYDDVRQGELMQQLRVFGLKSWASRGICRCTSSKCGNCDCDFAQHPELYEEVGSAVYLPSNDLAVAREHALLRDYREGPPLKSSIDAQLSKYKRIGLFSTQTMPILLSQNEGMLLPALKGHEILFPALRIPEQGQVRRIRWKASFIFPRNKEGQGNLRTRLVFSFGRFFIPDSGSITCPSHIDWLSSSGHSGLSLEENSKRAILSIDPSRFTSHYEHDLNIPVQPGDFLKVSYFYEQDENQSEAPPIPGARIRFAEAQNGFPSSQSCVYKEGVLLHVGKMEGQPMINLDFFPTSQG